MGKLIPIILALIGLGAGAGAGIMLKPAVDMTEAATDDHGGDGHDDHGKSAAKDTGKDDHDAHGDDPPSDVEFVKLNNQFVIPVVNGSKVAALVVMSLSLEVSLGQREYVYQVEPKLRDAFLQVLFDHANAGGFDGNFTDTAPMATLRNALREVAGKIVGPDAHDVLIVDLVRQDSAS